MSDLAAVIDRFEQRAALLRRAVQGLSEQDLHARLGPGAWSIHEVVIHLADSDAILMDRMKRVIAEQEPRFFSADESAYVQRLHCDAQSLEDALTLFEVGRRQFARVLRRLSPADFERAGHHNIAGRVTLRDLLQTCVKHLDHHLPFIIQKRGALGKPLDGGLIA